MGKSQRKDYDSSERINSVKGSLEDLNSSHSGRFRAVFTRCWAAKCTTLFICIREWYDVEFSRVRKALDEASAHLNELSGEDVQAAISVGDQRLPTCVIWILPESKRK